MLVADVAAGTRLGKYRIDERLGKGGMGVVYAGEDTRLRRRVAIKVLAENAVHEADALRRFLLEARAAARLNHPHVVTVHDVGQRGSIYYIVMELVAGGSVQARLQAQGPLPWREATRIAADVCRGLAAAHAAGLIHRDVKPANILLTADGVAKLADFGLTKAPALLGGNLTQAGTIVGTPEFMSPEHCTGEPLDERTDIYSLGAAYYTLLVNRFPYENPDPTLVLYAHCSEPPPDPRAADPTVPVECANIVLRAMAKSRSERFQSANAMLAALESVLAEPLAASRTPPTAPTAIPNQRWLPIIVLALGLLCTLVFLAIRYSFHSPGSVPTPAKDVALRPDASPLFAHRGPVKAVSIAMGRLASAGVDGTVRLWDAASGRLLRTLDIDSGPLETVAVAPDGKYVAAGGQGKKVHLYDASGVRLGEYPFPSGIGALAFAPSGSHLAVASASELTLCEMSSAGISRRLPLLEKQYMVSSIAFSADGKRLAACTGEGIVHLWELGTLKHRTAPGTFSGRLTTVALSPDGRRVAFGSHDGVVHLWAPDSTAPPLLWSAKEGSVAAALFLPGGQLVFAGEWGGPMRLCSVTARQATPVPANVAGVVSGLASDGRKLAAACSDGSVRLWNVQEK